MNGLKIFLFAYLFGGITFIPLLAISFLYFNKKFNPIDENEDLKDKTSDLLVSDIDRELKAGKIEEKTGVDVWKSGWMTITNQYYYHSTELNELDSDDDSILQRSQLRKRHRLFGTLREGNLFLYRDDSPKSNLVHAISLNNMFVTIWPRCTSGQPLPDASLFTKRTCIALFRDGAAKLSDDGKTVQLSTNNIIETSSNQEPSDLKTSKANQFYLYFDNNMDKEDWYFELINASKNITNKNETSALNPNLLAETAHINTHDMLYLIQTLNSTKGQLNTKWLNALIGRLFLSLQQTDTLNQVLLDKIYKKLTKINRPGFLDDFVIEKVDVGNSIPFLTNPQLSELSPQGTMKLLTDISYKGSLEIIVSTKVNINLGSHFKQREVSLQLSIKLNEITGPLEVLIKPPPSNRIWYAFASEPILNLEIEPVVSSSKISYNVVTNAIKGKFAEAIKESLVVPFYDDIVFYSTTDDIYRGGIWSKGSSLSQGAGSSSQYPPVYAVTSRDEGTSTRVSDKREGKLFHRKSSSLREPSTKSKVLEKTGVLKQGSDKNDLSDSDESSTKKLDYKPRISSSNAAVDNLTDNETNESPTKPKKYFKNSIKKINRWYKETVNNNENDISNESSESSSDDENEKINDDTEETNEIKELNTIEERPKMISNRRIIHKKVSQTGLANPINLPSEDNDETRSENSPVVVATEMFVNKQRSISTSSSGKNTNHTTSYSQFTNSNMKEYY